MCKNYSETGFCPYFQKCQFAHGEHELCKKQNTIKQGYRTRKCKSFWETGSCKYGSRCQFSHSEVPKANQKRFLGMVKGLFEC